MSENTLTFILFALTEWIWLAWREELLPSNCSWKRRGSKLREWRPELQKASITSSFSLMRASILPNSPPQKASVLRNSLQQRASITSSSLLLRASIHISPQQKPSILRNSPQPKSSITSSSLQQRQASCATLSCRTKHHFQFLATENKHRSQLLVAEDKHNFQLKQPCASEKVMEKLYKRTNSTKWSEIADIAGIQRRIVLDKYCAEQKTKILRGEKRKKRSHDTWDMKVVGAFRYYEASENPRSDRYNFPTTHSAGKPQQCQSFFSFIKWIFPDLVAATPPPIIPTIPFYNCPKKKTSLSCLDRTDGWSLALHTPPERRIKLLLLDLFQELQRAQRAGREEFLFASLASR